MEELFTRAYYRDGCEYRDSERGRVLVAVTRDCRHSVASRAALTVRSTVVSILSRLTARFFWS